MGTDRRFTVMFEPIAASDAFQPAAAGLRWRPVGRRPAAALSDLADRDVLLTWTASVLSRRAAPCALLLLDVDGLRRINHRLGSAAGDEVLSTLARRLVAATRSGDVVARLGGDEFGILFAGLESDEEATVLATRLAWAAESEYTIGANQVPLRVSIGIARAIPGCTAESLLNDAEAAMYAAKSREHGRLVQYTAQLRHATLDRYDLESQFRQALESSAFELHYQPLYSLPDRRIVATEALLRWNHSGRGWVSPTDFVPVAEDTGLIVPLGHWVVDTATAQLAAWHRQGSRQSMSINVSPRQLADPDLIFQVRDLLASSAAPPGSITFEITEGQVMRNLDIAVPAMRTLRSFGARLSIDDFGTGYASLTQLKDLPADELKLDRSFITGLEHEGREREVVRAAVGVAHALGLSVVAEGVETQRQLDCLEDLGCDVIQGFLLGRPQPADAMSAELLDQAWDGTSSCA